MFKNMTLFRIHYVITLKKIIRKARVVFLISLENVVKC